MQLQGQKDRVSSSSQVQKSLAAIGLKSSLNNTLNQVIPMPKNTLLHAKGSQLRGTTPTFINFGGANAEESTCFADDNDTIQGTTTNDIGGRISNRSHVQFSDRDGLVQTVKQRPVTADPSKNGMQPISVQQAATEAIFKKWGFKSPTGVLRDCSFTVETLAEQKTFRAQHKVLFNKVDRMIKRELEEEEKESKSNAPTQLPSASSRSKHSNLASLNRSNQYRAVTPKRKAMSQRSGYARQHIKFH